jgi:hypothetical protein
MLACITGGYNIKERLRCINELKGFGAAGYVIVLETRENSLSNDVNYQSNIRLSIQ